MGFYKGFTIRKIEIRNGPFPLHVFMSNGQFINFIQVDKDYMQKV